MIMNRDNNIYTVLYATVLVIIVAAALAVASDVLKVPQEKNKKIEKKMNILTSVGKAANANNISDKNTYIENEYKKYIVEEFLINSRGLRIEGNAFNIDLKAEMKKPEIERLLPVFVCNDNGNKLYIIPVRGAGLWGAIWGYVSLKNDFSTIFGAVFDHAGETPGLGAEIATPLFQKQFSGKKIYRNGQFISVDVVKNGSVPLTDYNVDGITGGTITSKAVGDMLRACLSNYQTFFNNQKQE